MQASGPCPWPCKRSCLLLGSARSTTWLSPSLPSGSCCSRCCCWPCCCCCCFQGAVAGGSVKPPGARFALSSSRGTKRATGLLQLPSLALAAPGDSCSCLQLGKGRSWKAGPPVTACSWSMLLSAAPAPAAAAGGDAGNDVLRPWTRPGNAWGDTCVWGGGGGGGVCVCVWGGGGGGGGFFAVFLKQWFGHAVKL
jgi:hypothetical protein